MPDSEQRTFQKRQVAYKVLISDILDYNFVGDKFSSGYVRLGNLNVSRVNIVGNVVYKSKQGLNYTSAVIDDGTGNISLKLFENSASFSEIDIGDFVLIIGRIREFNNEKYIVPEILKKIDNIGWVNVRKLELKSLFNVEQRNTNKILNDELIEVPINSLNEEIYMLIKKLDNGDGVFIEDVIKYSNRIGAEDVINKLLENGDVFEIKRGKLKVLE